MPAAKSSDISPAAGSGRIGLVAAVSIGIGGMGVVVSALHKKLGQRVAVKFLSRSMQTADLVDRFIREGQACARIKSEHIARVMDRATLIRSHVYGVNGGDVASYITTGALRLVVSVAACLRPMSRALAVDAAIAMRASSNLSVVSGLTPAHSARSSSDRWSGD